MAFMFLREINADIPGTRPGGALVARGCAVLPRVHAVMWHQLSHCAVAGTAAFAGAVLVAYRALAHRHRDPSRGEARPPAGDRPRHGRGDRRDGRDRRRLLLVPPGHAGRGARPGAASGTRRSATTSSSAPAPRCWGRSRWATTRGSAPTRWCWSRCRPTPRWSASRPARSIASCRALGAAFRPVRHAVRRQPRSAAARPRRAARRAGRAGGAHRPAGAAGAGAAAPGEQTPQPGGRSCRRATSDAAFHPRPLCRDGDGRSGHAPGASAASAGRSAWPRSPRGSSSACPIWSNCSASCAAPGW